MAGPPLRSVAGAVTMASVVPVLVVLAACGGARATSLRAGTSDVARPGTAFPLGAPRLLDMVAVLVASGPGAGGDFSRGLDLVAHGHADVLPAGDMGGRAVQIHRVAAEQHLGGRRRRWVGCPRPGRRHGGPGSHPSLPGDAWLAPLCARAQSGDYQ